MFLHHFARGNNTIGRIISQSTVAIWNCLHETYMPMPDKEGWKQYSSRFQELCDIPNFVGSIDGKNIPIQKLPRTGSEISITKPFIP